MDTDTIQPPVDPPAPPRPTRGRRLLLALTIVAAAWLLVAAGFFPPAGRTKGDTLRLLGRFHVLIVHLPVTLLPLALLFEAMGLFKRFDHLKRAAGLVLGLGALSAVAAAVHGYLLASADGYEVTSLLKWHMWTGIAVAIAAMACWTLRCHASGRRWAGGVHGLLLTGTVGTLVVASHFGGSLSHGEDYLTEFLPPSIRARLGIQLHKKASSPTTQAGATRPSGPPTVYADIIAPALQQHCVLCHGAVKTKGGLRLDSLEGLLKGGKTGPVITPRNPAASDLYRRITLKSDDDDYMPADGKPALPADVVKIIGWWIQDGASPQRTLDDLKSAPEEIRQAAASSTQGDRR
ncbi:MAG: c-type cytochrome domain-containing protein [Tepidisphaerales bacterium]